MQVKRSLKLLTKINDVFKHIIDEGDALSALERQLLKNYIIDLYDAVNEETSETAPDTSNNHVEKPSITKSVREVTEPKPVQIVVPAQPTKPKPTTVEPPKATVYAEQSGVPLSAATQESVQAATAEVKTTATVATTTKEGALDSFYTSIDAEIKSGHLGQTLIKDLKKSIGLNDKLRYANDLFAGNQSKLLETLDLVNQESDRDKIKSHLNDLAEEFNWTSPTRTKTLTHFLHLIFSKK